MKPHLITCLIFSLLAGAVAGGPAKNHYRVFRSGEDHEGTLSEGDTPEPPTNSIVLITCRGKREGPFLKANGFNWVKLPGSPCFTPIHLRPADTLAFNDAGLPVNVQQTFAYVNKEDSTVLVTTTLKAREGGQMKKLQDLLSGLSLGRTTNEQQVKVTYKVHLANPLAEVSISGATPDSSITSQFKTPQAVQFQESLRSAMRAP